MTKKVKSAIIILMVLMLMLSNVVFAEPIKVVVNNNQLTLPIEPAVVSGRTLVPLKAIFEAMGATVEWEQSTRTVTGIQGNKIIKLQLDNKTALVDEKEVNLDVAATAINGSTLVPTRFIAESLGAEVDWDNNTKSVLVNSDYPFGKYKVIRVVDGDTFIVDFNGKEERVRLIGVDTPESVHPDATKNVAEGKIASEYTKNKLEGKEVALEFDVQERDHYGRLLAYAWIGGEMFNKVLLQEGYAQIATYPPNVRYVEEFTQIQRIARKTNKGLWNDNAFNGESLSENTTSSNTDNTIVKTSGRYVGSLKSDKYHKPTCRHAKNITQYNEIWFDTIEEAAALGYNPCGVCKP